MRRMGTRLTIGNVQSYSQPGQALSLLVHSLRTGVGGLVSTLPIEWNAAHLPAIAAMPASNAHDGWKQDMKELQVMRVLRLPSCTSNPRRATHGTAALGH